MEQFFQSSLCIHLMLQGNCKAFVVTCERGMLQRVWQCVLPLPWLALRLPFTHTLSLQKPAGCWLQRLTSCAVVLVEELWESAAPMDQGYMTSSAVLRFSFAFLLSICKALLESLPCLSEKKLLSSLLVLQPCDKAPTALEPLEQGKGNESSVHLQREELMRSYKMWRAREISWNGTKLNAFTLHCSINAK